jgi:TonB dependent receptor/TonB-dependent Receptor Plug Domain
MVLILLAGGSSMAQMRVQVVVKDAGQQPLRQAQVVLGQLGMAADSTGTARYILAPGQYALQVTAFGYDTLRMQILLTSDTTLYCTLQPDAKQLNEVVLRSSRNVTDNQLGRQTISASQLRRMPVLLGEIDPLKTITLLPGIKSGGEAGAGIYVRGGGPDQNLVLMDGVPVYNPNHLLGFFSIFNGEAIKDVEVFKGGMPAEYGGRLSSVIAINTREGDKQATKVSGGVGLISSRLSVETPIVKNKSSFIISARRTYIDQVARLVASDRVGGNGYFFYDVNAKADYILNANNKLNLVFYAGRDNFTFSNNTNGRNRTFNTNWGNTLGGLNWQQQLGSRLQHTTGLVYNNFGLDSRFGFSTLSFLFASGLRDYQLKTDWQYRHSEKLQLRWGAQYTWHRFRPGAGGVTAGVQEFKSQIKDQYAHEAAAYASADWKPTEKLGITAGLRYSYFNQVGPTEKILYGADGVPTGERIIFGKGQSIAQYHYPEPRLNLLYRLSEQASIKMAYTQTIQYLQLATTSSATFPSDLWLPASELIKPGKARQISLGYFKNFRNNMYELSVETYYKTLTNQLEFRPGAQLLLNQNLEGEMIFGSGVAYGVELFVQKKTGRLTGWLGYTLSRTERTFAELNQGKAFPYRYDRTHDLSLVANYTLSKKWEFSGVFVYGTGNALTLPTGRFGYSIGYNPATQQPLFTNVNQYTAINDYRMPAYHRLDVSFTYTKRPDSKKKYKSSWNFSIYNLYNRYNPFFIYLDADTDTQTVKGKQVFLFPIIPGVTWNFKF